MGKGIKRKGTEELEIDKTEGEDTPNDETIDPAQISSMAKKVAGQLEELMRPTFDKRVLFTVAVSAKFLPWYVTYPLLVGYMGCEVLATTKKIKKQKRDHSGHRKPAPAPLLISMEAAVEAAQLEKALAASVAEASAAKPAAPVEPKKDADAVVAQNEKAKKSKSRKRKI